MSQPKHVSSLLAFAYSFQGGPADGWHGVADVLLEELVTVDGEVYRLGIETPKGVRMMKDGVWIYGHVGTLPGAKKLPAPEVAHA